MLFSQLSLGFPLARRKSSCGLHPATSMAEPLASDEAGSAGVDENGKLPKLSDIEKSQWAEELHPSMAGIDDLQQELVYHWRLLRETWTVLHYRALIVGILAFWVGSLNTDLLSGGDPFVTGLEGIRSSDGLSFFQMLLSMVLWVWFVVQIWSLFPIMKGHTMNLLSAWLAGMISMILFHVTSPSFPFEFIIGEMLGGLVGVFVMVFLAFIVGRAVLETRDEHVNIRHFSEDARKLEEAVAEHSLNAWAVSLGVWLALVLVNTWSGVHFVADRLADDESLLVIHLITGPLVVLGLMHIIWFPQLMLGVGDTKVLSKRARLTSSNVATKSEESPGTSSKGTIEETPQLADNKDYDPENAVGECPECKKPAPIFRHGEGEPGAPCPKDNCQGSGAPNSHCSLCKTIISSRWTCDNCGVNAPLVDYLPDGDAW